MLAEIEVPDPQICSLSDPRAGVVEEHEQGPVPQCEAARARQTGEERLDLFTLEEARLGWRHPLHRDRRHLLADREHLQRSPGDVLEEAVECGESLIAGAGAVVAIHFEVAEEPLDPIEREIGERKPGDRAPLVPRDEHEQEPDRVPVAADRGRPEALHRDEVVDEERVEQGPERRVIALGTGSVQAGSANASKRRFASSSRAGVTVR